MVGCGGVKNACTSLHTKQMSRSMWSLSIWKDNNFFAPIVTKFCQIRKAWETTLMPSTVLINVFLNRVNLHNILRYHSILLDVVSSMLSKLVSELGTLWQCNECFYNSRVKTNVVEHIETQHMESEGIICPECNKICPNKKSLRNHRYQRHKNV